ncbi:MAG: ABC transporter substrate-binding protein [Parvibaculaceae bacterium]|nr:ABC transporter substrate-binding protein [Parvibaculaceae bacterium]
MIRRLAAMLLGTLLLSLAMAAPARAAEKLTVLLDWFVNPDHAPLFVADYIGAYKAEGLEVDLIPPANPDLPPRLLAAKQADLAISYQPQLYLLADQGLPLVRVGTLIDTPLNTVMALDGTGIAKLSDFKGKKIGYSISGVEEATIASMLASAGLSLSDVTLVNVNFQLVSALLSKQVDGVVGAYRTFEANELKEHGHKAVMFFPEEHGIPDYDELVILANRDNVHDPRIPRFLVALRKATTYLINHPEECWQMFVKAHPDLDNNVNRISWFETISRFAKNPAYLDGPRYEAYAKFMYDEKLIKKIPALDSYAIDGSGAVK